MYLNPISHLFTGELDRCQRQLFIPGPILDHCLPFKVVDTKRLKNIGSWDIVCIHCNFKGDYLWLNEEKI